MDKEPFQLAGNQNFRRFTLILSLVCVLFASIPTLVAWVGTPPTKFYLGVQTAADDSMVYAAWMRQAMDGHFLFDNRFTEQSQPGLTIHLYFLVLGWLSKLVTIPVATNLARLGFTFLFVRILGRLIEKLNVSLFTGKLAMLLAIFGAGFGAIQWEEFGRLATQDSSPLNAILNGRLSIDVWQPEAFTAPSMLVNGLFIVSLCLIVQIFISVLEAKNSWKPVWLGAGCMFLLMNIHSYDVLIIAFVLVGFLVTLLSIKQMDTKWIARSAVIGFGAIPSALYFLYVLSQDEVFQARAETLTYSPTFRQILVGILPLVILCFVKLADKEYRTKKVMVGSGILLGVILTLTIISANANPESYFLTFGSWAIFAIAIFASIFLMASKDLVSNLILSWASLSIILPYFPQLFQRKLAMGMAIPWAICGAIGFAKFIEKQERNTRNLVSALVVVIVSASSIFWFQREILFIRNNVSSTTVQPIYYQNDLANIIKKLNEIPGRKVVTAIPGIPLPQQEGFAYASPYIPDWNPILSGMSGAYTVAGHWSETPNYDQKREDMTKLYLNQASEFEREELINKYGIQYLVIPDTTAFEDLPIHDFSHRATTIYEGRLFSLVKVVQSN